MTPANVFWLWELEIKPLGVNEETIVLFSFKFFPFWGPTLKLASWGYIHFVMNPFLEPRHPGGLMKPGLGLEVAGDCVVHLIFSIPLGERTLVLFSLVEDFGIQGFQQLICSNIT